uniref:Uncharacterized protein n=1 Tax=Plectus sambesii TaxID=2011161 RepID=A0A914WDB6_9BILA
MDHGRERSSGRRHEADHAARRSSPRLLLSPPAASTRRHSATAKDSRYSSSIARPKMATARYDETSNGVVVVCRAQQAVVGVVAIINGRRREFPVSYSVLLRPAARCVVRDRKRERDRQ